MLADREQKIVRDCKWSCWKERFEFYKLADFRTITSIGSSIRCPRKLLVFALDIEFPNFTEFSEL